MSRRAVLCPHYPRPDARPWISSRRSWSPARPDLAPAGIQPARPCPHAARRRPCDRGSASSSPISAGCRRTRRRAADLGCARCSRASPSEQDLRRPPEERSEKFHALEHTRASRILDATDPKDYGAFTPKAWPWPARRAIASAATPSSAGARDGTDWLNGTTPPPRGRLSRTPCRPFQESDPCRTANPFGATSRPSRTPPSSLPTACGACPSSAYGESPLLPPSTRRYLEKEGFRVTRRPRRHPTAVMMGEAGEGGPVIAILGECRRAAGPLPDEAGVAEQQAHAGRWLWPWLRPQPARLRLHARGRRGEGLARPSNGITGRVRYYGCGRGRRRCQGLHGAAPAPSPMWISRSPGTRRPSPACNEPISPRQHPHRLHLQGPRQPRRRGAASRPQALDAVELMTVGVNYMREHMPCDARIHYAYLDAGGMAPNVVQAQAKSLPDPRAPTCRS